MRSQGVKRRVGRSRHSGEVATIGLGWRPNCGKDAKPLGEGAKEIGRRAVTMVFRDVEIKDRRVMVEWSKWS